MLKRIIAIILAVLMIAAIMVGCSTTHECSICGEVKSCTKKTILGQEIYICDDCATGINSIFG